MDKTSRTPITVIDPGVPNPDGSQMYNTGNVIIQRAVTRELRLLFGDPEFYRINPHIRMTDEDRNNIAQSDRIFVGGSNLLGNRVFKKRQLRWWSQWKVNLADAKLIGQAVLLGVGWRRYEGKTGFYTRRIFKNALCAKSVHSVRDQYTKEKLEALGFKAVNTGCPTTWPLMNSSAEDFPSQKADNALVMLTNYSKRSDQDKKLLDLVCANYKKVYFWPQGTSDLEYMQQFGNPIEPLSSDLKALDNFVQNVNFDYIGTRLHGGIHCLLEGRRALVIKIDNRAAELGRNINLPVADRDDYDCIANWIENPSPIDITIDSQAIESWKGQFK